MAKFNKSASTYFPSSIKNVLDLIVKELSPSKIILFGSRARKDHRENSDFDLCIVGAKLEPEFRNRVRIAIEEDPITLFKVDLLFFEELNQNYLENIEKEGVELYG